MTELTPPIKVSGVPLDSRASRRIKPSAGGPAERLGTRMRRIHPLLVSWIVANVGAVLLSVLMIGLGLFVTKVLLSSGTMTRTPGSRAGSTIIWTEVPERRPTTHR